MRFHFTAMNHGHPWKDTLIDMYRWLHAGLTELGHEVSYSPDQLEPSAINVAWEGFKPYVAEKLAASGIRYGLIVTEFMDGTGFNRGTPQSKEANRRDAAYVERWLGFTIAAKGASFFWSMVESNVAPLRKMKPASFVELGYSDWLVPKDLREPTIDFSFSGIMTPNRKRVIERLAEKAKVVFHPGLLPIKERDALFHATKVNLSPNKTVDWEMPSPTRLGMALHSRRGIALGWTPQQTRQSQLIEVCPKEADYVDFCISVLQSDWRASMSRALERYRAEIPMKGVVERLLDETTSTLA